MIKPFAIFLGGGAFGVIAASTMFSTNLVTPPRISAMDLPANVAGAMDSPSPALSQQIQQLNSSIGSLAQIADRLESSLSGADAPLRTATRLPAASDSSSPQETAPPAREAMTDSSSQPLARDQPITPAPAEPTPRQVDQYYSIQNRLYNAANNHNASLFTLVEDSKSLTPEQREALTREAMDMIRRGELKAEQFSKLPGT